MMRAYRNGKINVKVLVIVATVVIALGAAAFAARHVRRRILSAQALEAGRAALAREDWPEAYTQLREYLSRNPDDVEMLRKYAEASLSVRPLSAKQISAALGAYRRVIVLDPTDRLPYEKLAGLYAGLGEFGELAYIARKRMEHAPGDLRAPVWLGEALLALRKPEEARKVLDGVIAKIDGLPDQDDKHEEFVQACALMSSIAAAADSDQARMERLRWLDRAVDYDGRSTEALLHRARFYRLPPPPELSDSAKEEHAEKNRSAAQRDLTKADELGTKNPRIRLALSEEWMAHGELDRAVAELKAVDELDATELKEAFFDPKDWIFLRFRQMARLAFRKGVTKKDATPAEKALEKLQEKRRKEDATRAADEALEKLQEKRRRTPILPYAVRVYVAAGRTADGRRCLDEYLDAVRTASEKPASHESLGYLRAIVARAEDEPYRVIDVLAPVVVTAAARADLWQLLAEAYSRTDQSRMSVRALIRYLLLNPRDPKMTLQLAKEYLKLSDWNRAFQTARLAEPLDPADIVIKLLRIEASIYLAAERRYRIDKARLGALSEELAGLRVKHPDRVDIRILQAIIAIYQERPAVAEKELKLAIKECEEPLRAEMQLVRHYFRTKQLPKALEACRTSCDRHKKMAEPWLALSGLLAAEGKNVEARKVLQSGAVVGRWEKRTVAIRLALLELLHGDRKAGLDLLKGLAEKDRQEIRARSLLLSLREVRNDRPLARKLVNEVREAQGQSGLLWRMYEASLWLSEENWRSKQQDITEALRLCMDTDPEWSAPVLLLVEMYRRLGQLGHAEEECRRALSRNPSATDVADQLVTLLEKQGRFSDAQKILKSLETNPRVVSAWYVRLAVRAGEFSNAIDELKLRASNDDRDANSRILLARLVYWQSRDAEQAFRYLREAEAISAESIALASAKVMILKAEGRTDEAKAVLEDQIRKQETFGAYLMRGAYLMATGQLGPAEKDFVKLTTFPGKEASGFELLASFYSETDRPDGTVAALRKGVQTCPDSASLKRSLMLALFRRDAEGDSEQAVQILTGLEKRFPNGPDLMRIRAVHLAQNATPESLDKARQILVRAARLAPTSVPTYIALIGVVMQQGDFKAARDFAVAGLAANPEDVSLLVARADAELALGNTPMAAQLARLALRSKPDSTEARDVLVMSALKSGDRGLLGDAKSLVGEALARKPADEQPQLNQARILAALGETGAAATNLEAYCGTTEGGKSVDAVLALAELYRARGDLDESDKRIEQAATLSPDSTSVLQARMRLLGSRRKFGEITKLVSPFRSKEPKELGVLLAAAFILSTSESRQNLDDALKLYEDVLAAAPDAMSARLGMASAVYKTGDAARAVRLYREILTQNPTNVTAMNDLAWILSEHGHDHKAAIELADRGLQLEPEDRHLLDTRGVILRNTGRLGDARKDFEKLVKICPPESRAQAKALLQLGRTCDKLKDQAGAKRSLAHALRIDREKQVFSQKERSEIKTLMNG